MDTIVRGRDWIMDITVGPTSDETNSDVITYLTGATVSASLKFFGQTVSPAPTAAVQSANDRTIRVTYTDTNTAELPARDEYYLSVSVTTSGGLVFAVEILEKVRVVDA